MAKLTKAERITLQLAKEFAPMRVFPEQRDVVRRLSGKGMIVPNWTEINATAHITPAGLRALSEHKVE